ncbi:MAG: acylphosphatase [Phycisphaerae bacterium]
MKVRRTLCYSGRVQGVGFRATACAVAERFAITGTVRNLPDGRVELVAEGDPSEVGRFAEALSERLGRFITGIHVEEAPASGAFDRFQIVY